MTGDPTDPIPASAKDQLPLRRDRIARRLSFSAVTAGYMAVTAAESLLAPLFPILQRDLGFSLRQAGFAFGLLAASIAVGNIIGGLALYRLGLRQGTVIGLAVAAAGAGLVAASGSRSQFLASQIVLGLGTGSFFPSGLSAAALLAGPRRRGLAIGFYGVAFSGGLALAALLAALAEYLGWRVPFEVAAAFAGASAVATAFARMPARVASPRSETRIAEPHAQVRAPRLSIRHLLGVPLVVGGVAAASQYGAVAFLPTFAVHAWGLSPSAAAVMLGVARVLSVPAKLVSGQGADRTGALRVARRLGVLLAATGLWWTIAPGPQSTVWAAVIFAAFVSGLGPVANLLAFEGFGERAMLLGVFRSAQIGAGAAAGVAIGALAGIIGLRAALIAAAVVPLVLLPLGRNWRRGDAPSLQREGDVEMPQEPGDDEVQVLYEGPGC